MLSQILPGRVYERTQTQSNQAYLAVSSRTI